MIKSMTAALAFTLMLGGAAMAERTAPAETGTPGTEILTQAAPAPQTDTAATATAPATTAAAPATAPAPVSTPAAPAGTVPATADACIAEAGELGVVAESRTLTDEQIDTLDQLFSRMETMCDGRQFAEAMAVAKDIRQVLQIN